MKRRTRNLLFTTVGLLCLLAIVTTVVHQRQERAVEAYKRELRAKGEKLTIAENIPPPVPPEQNSVDLVRRAFGLLNSAYTTVVWSNPPPAMRMVAPGKAMVGWKQPEIRSWEATNTWEDVEQALAFDRAGLTLLHQVIERPNIDFQLDYSQGAFVRLSHLAPLKSATHKSTVSALFDLHHGDCESATTEVRAALALIKAMKDEPMAITQLVRAAMIAIVLNATWELLQSPDVTDDQFAELQEDWSELDLINAANNALSMERALTEATIKKIRKSPAEYHRLLSGYSAGGVGGTTSGSGDWIDQAQELVKEGWRNGKIKGKEFMWRISWSHSDQLRTFKGYQVLLETARFAESNQFFLPALNDQTNSLVSLGILSLDYDLTWGADPADMDMRVLFSQSVESLARFLNRVMKAEVAKRMAVTAIALKRYELKHGHYPETLAELTPHFLPAIPLDPVDGRLLRFRLNPDGTFLLYSIGDDGKDDGGDPTPTRSPRSMPWQYGRDSVWPTPATDEEIRLYETNKNK